MTQFDQAYDGFVSFIQRELSFFTRLIMELQEIYPVTDDLVQYLNTRYCGDLEWSQFHDLLIQHDFIDHQALFDWVNAGLFDDSLGRDDIIIELSLVPRSEAKALQGLVLGVDPLYGRLLQALGTVTCASRVYDLCNYTHSCFEQLARFYTPEVVRLFGPPIQAPKVLERTRKEFFTNAPQTKAFIAAIEARIRAA